MRSVAQLVSDVFHFFTDQMHYEHPLDEAVSSHPGGLIGHTTPPKPNLRVVDEGGLGPRVDDEG